MLRNFLLFDGFHIDGGLGAGAFYAVLGFVFVFCGIALLVGFFSLLGLIMKKVNARKPKQKKPKRAKGKGNTVPEPEKEEIPAEVIAVLSAAIAAYYEEQDVPCDFVVRRIKKL